MTGQLLAYQPQLLGYFAAPCPVDPSISHLLPVTISGTTATVTSKMPFGPDIAVQPCPHCFWPRTPPETR